MAQQPGEDSWGPDDEAVVERSEQLDTGRRDCSQVPAALQARAALYNAASADPHLRSPSRLGLPVVADRGPGGPPVMGEWVYLANGGSSVFG